ncbi:hypothetical protein P2D89_25060, partial [Agrobacterium rhizogenes]|uniref:hypothetical protein n=1 Tax=Rhizobium rhizogenes TaxID=359 RepID=UPI00285A0874
MPFRRSPVTACFLRFGLYILTERLSQSSQFFVAKGRRLALETAPAERLLCEFDREHDRLLVAKVA